MLRAFCACLALVMALTLGSTGDSDAQSRSRRHQRHQQQTQPEPPPPPPPQPETPPPPVPQPAPVPAQPPPPVQQPIPYPTEQSPLPVKIMEAPKSDAELAAEQKDRDDRAALTERLTIYAGLLIAVGLFLALAFALQALYLWFALRAVWRSAVAAERNMTAVRRAFVYIGSMTWDVAGANVKVGPVWANSGTTPTRSLRISTNWKASHGELPPDFTYTYPRPPERLLLGSNARTEAGSMLIPMRDIQAAIEDRVQLYVWGRATYEDVFDGTEPHFVEFCHRIEAKGTAPNDIALTFVHYGHHNRSEQDSQRSAA
jgi:hypothetical protein